MYRTPRRWTTEEDEILLSTAEQQSAANGAISWTHVSKALPYRNNKDCRKRWYKLANTKKGMWTVEEDQRLLEGVQLHGHQWERVARVVGVGSRSADQCANRWNQNLDPSLDHSKWNHDQDARLFSAVMCHGTKWKDIKELEFPSRSSTGLKNRYLALRRRLNKNHLVCANGAETASLELAHAQNSFDNVPLAENSYVLNRNLDCSPFGFDQMNYDWEVPQPATLLPFESTLEAHFTPITNAATSVQAPAVLTTYRDPVTQESNRFGSSKGSFGITETIITIGDADSEEYNGWNMRERMW